MADGRSTRHHDLLIIGSGSGNSLITPELAKLDTGLVERGAFGGTCLNVGCIPTKMYVYPADVIVHAREALRLGVDFAEPATRWREVRDRVFGRIDPISEGGQAYRAGDPFITVYAENARFIAERTVQLDTGEILSADRVVVAAGSRPRMLAIDGLDRVDPERGVHSNETIMRVEEPPRRVAVLGGGYIAAEFAHVLDAFGSEVTVVQRSERLLSHLDDEVSRGFTDEAVKRYDVRLNTNVVAAERIGDEWHLTLATREAAAAPDPQAGAEAGGTLVVDAVLVAIGRIPNGDTLDAAAGGMELDEAGRIVVDEYQRTTAADTWALGDVSSAYMLKHVANHEARVVAHNLAHPDDLVTSDQRVVPAAVFSHPQIASFGPTERELRERGVDYHVKVQRYADTAYGWAMEDEVGFAKVLATPDGQLLGAHILGHEASLVIQPLVQGASFGTPAHDIAAKQYWPHPALMEVVENALLGLASPAEAPTFTAH